MKYDFLIFGADGIQGKIVARDLLENGYTVFLSDLYKTTLDDIFKHHHKKATFTFVDLRDIDRTISVIQKSGADVVINCAEGDWNMNVYNACLHTRTNCLDLGSHVDVTKEQLSPAVYSAFKEIDKTAITGCGSVPGIGNVMLRHAARKLDSINTIEAGFAWDSNIKKFVVPFSIESILEEFNAPAPYIMNKRWRKKMPLTSTTTRYFKSIGDQKIFLADHAETYTFYHYYKNKGCKNIYFWAGFPDHSTKVLKILTDLTFFDKKPIKFEGKSIRADEFLVQMLKRLKIPRGYKEWENLWVEISGHRARRKKKILMECLVPTLKGWEPAGCNIDTGMPASIMAQMIKNGRINKRGSFAPEGIVPEEPFFKELHKRQMAVYENGKKIN
ncbi:MAG: saccharopine dehydrogenase C-terminal domain-containing protein [bacterium]|nr:saccharopine dehydrogenase C-terminal domain-containing protein [bacterium]